MLFLDLTLKYPYAVPCSGVFFWVRTHMLSAVICLWNSSRLRTGGQRHPDNVHHGSKGVKSLMLTQRTLLNTAELYSLQL